MTKERGKNGRRTQEYSDRSEFIGKTPEIVQLEKRGAIRQIAEAVGQGQIVAIKYPGDLYGLVCRPEQIAQLQAVKNRYDRPFSAQAPLDTLVRVFDLNQVDPRHLPVIRDPKKMAQIFAGRAFARGIIKKSLQRKLPQMAYGTDNSFHVLTFGNYKLYRQLERALYKACGRKPWLLTSCNPTEVDTYTEEEQVIEWAKEVGIPLVVGSNVKARSVERYKVITFIDSESQHSSCPVPWLEKRFDTIGNWLETLEERGIHVR